MPSGPSPDERFPIPGVARTGFLKPFITRPNIVVGDYGTDITARERAE